MQDEIDEVEIIQETKVNGSQFKAEDIFKGLPEEYIQEYDTPPVNKNDFEEATLIEEIKENYDEKKAEKKDEVTDPISQEDVRKEELSEKSKEIKKKFVSMINPKSVISFADFAFSRGGSFAMRKTDKKDWRLDPEEKEFLTEVLEVMIEEEGIEFWPAKVWLILALLFFYGMKTMDNYMKFYTQKSIDSRQPLLILEERKKQKESELAEIEAMEIELEILQKRSILEKRINQVREAMKRGESAEDIVENEKVKAIQKEAQIEELKKLYPEDEYFWKNGELQYNLDGSVAKKRGIKSGTKRHIHPVTKQFLSDENYKKLVDSGEIPADDEEAEFVETEEVN